MGDVLEQISQRGKIVVHALAGTVHIIVDSNKVNVMLREHDLCIHAHLQIAVLCRAL